MQRAAALWSPGLWLMRGLDLRAKALLLFLGWLPIAVAGLLGHASGGFALAPWHELLEGRFATPLGPRWALAGALSGLMVLSLLASIYVALCAWISLSQELQRLRDGADEHKQRLRDLAARQSQALAEARTGLRLHHAEVSGAVGELARRTVALCGMLDADMQDAERIGVDLDAIQDEERHALQLMSALRARLLALAQHCEALSDAAAAAVPSQLHGAMGSSDELRACISAELVHCHQLSERVGGAERLNERRIQSMRRGTERLQYRAERALLEGRQLMALTRQIQAAQAAAQEQLQQIAASCVARGSPSQRCH